MSPAGIPGIPNDPRWIEEPIPEEFKTISIEMVQFNGLELHREPQKQRGVSQYSAIENRSDFPASPGLRYFGNFFDTKVSVDAPGLSAYFNASNGFGMHISPLSPLGMIIDTYRYGECNSESAKISVSNSGKEAGFDFLGCLDNSLHIYVGDFFNTGEIGLAMITNDNGIRLFRQVQSKTSVQVYEWNKTFPF